MKIDDKPVTREELVRLAELLGWEAWINLDSLSARFPIGIGGHVNHTVALDDIAELAVLVANRLAAMRAEYRASNKLSAVYFDMHLSGDDSFTAFITDQHGTEGHRWSHSSPDFAEAVLTAAIRWTRAVIERDAAEMFEARGEEGKTNDDASDKALDRFPSRALAILPDAPDPARLLRSPGMDSLAPRD